MKKALIILSFILIASLLTLSAYAKTDGEVTHANMQALWDYWVANAEENALSMYPEGVCGVWCDGDMSRVTIKVTKDDVGEAAKASILASLEDSRGVKFTYGAYSHQELRQIQTQLEARLTTGEWEEYGIYWMGVDEQHNVLAIGINTNDPDAKTFINTMFTAYHDRVAFEHCDGVFDYVQDVSAPKQADTKVYVITYSTMVDPGLAGAYPGFTFIGFDDIQPKNYTYLWILIPSLLLILSAAGTLIWRKKRSNMAVLSTGETVAEEVPSVKQAVTDAAVSPSPDLDRRILDSVKKSSK